MIRSKEFEEDFFNCNYIVEKNEGNEFVQAIDIQKEECCIEKIYENGNVYKK